MKCRIWTLCWMIILVFWPGGGILYAHTKTLKVGVYDNPPKVFLDKNNQPSGFIIDITHEIARKQGFKLEFVFDTWNQHLKHNILDGTIDLLPDVSWSAARAQVYRFNMIPVIESWVQFFTLPGIEVNSVNDLDGKTIAVLNGSLQQIYMEREFPEKFGVNIKLAPYDSYSEAVQDVVDGRTDVLLADRFYYFFASNQNLLSPGTLILNPVNIHFAFHKNIPQEIIAAFDNTLGLLKNDPKSAYYNSLNKWIDAGVWKTAPFYTQWVFYVWLLIALLLAAAVYSLWKKLVINSRELKFRGAILESANKMLEEMLEERRKAEIALRESEESFKSLFTQSSDPVLLLNNNKFIDCNSATLHSLGYLSKGEIEGKTPWEISPPFQTDGIPSEQKGVLLIAEAFAKGNNRFEWTHQRADGTTFMVDVTLTSIIFKGERIIHASLRDINERKAAEFALKESEERYRILVDHQTDLIVKVDSEGKFIFVSPSYCRTFGKTSEQLLGNTFIPLVHPDDQQSTIDTMEQLKLPPYNCYLEQRALTTKGWRWFSWVDTAILDSQGSITEIIGVGRDITESVKARQELMNQKTFIQTVLDNLPIGVAINEFSSGRASYMNKKFAEIYGWPEDELANTEKYFELVYPEPDYRKQVKEMVISGINSGNPERMKWENISITTSTGETRIISAANIPLEEQNIMVSTVMDKTIAYNSEMEIKKERDKLRLLFSIARKIAHEEESLENILQYTIESICTETGWDLGEAWLPDGMRMVCSGAFYFTDPSIAPFIEISRSYSFRPGVGIPGRVWESKQPVWVFDIQNDPNFLRFKEARDFNIATGVGIPIMAGDTVVSVLVFFMKQPMQKDDNLVELVSGIGIQLGEVFRRKSIQIQQLQIAEKLRKSDHQLHQTRKIAGIGTLEFDFNLGLVNGSDEAKKIYGLQGNSFPIPEVRKMVLEQYRQALDQAFEMHKLHGKPYDVVFQIERADDKQIRFIHCIGEFIPAENRFKGIIRDITESKTNEKLKQEILVARESARFKEKFLAQISHEIRTPLTAVEGMLEMLEKTQLDERQLDYLETIRFSSENLKNIINEVLDYTRIEAGGISLSPVTFETGELFLRAQRLFRAICKKNTQLHSVSPDDLPAIIIADKQRIFQIITNLISNAVKYGGNDDVTITIKKAGYATEKSNFFRVEVADRGPGINQRLKQKLFKPFTQLHSNQEMQIEGTGLGLAICKELARLLGGEIGYEDNPGGGSIFWFTFAAEPAQKHPATNDAKSLALSGSEKNSLRILLAEDKEVNRKVIALILSSMGHHVTMAENGKEAVELFSPEDFDLVLMDIQMPVMDGITATQKIKETFPQALVPVVGLSANAMKGDRENFMEQGMDDYITKPVRTDDFNQLLTRLNLG